MKKTKIINLFGAPGAGKSTGAAYIFYNLKTFNINCEYVTEFAKDKVWEENNVVFEDQNYMFGKQSFKLSRVNGKVDVIVTDSPLLLPAFYGNDNCKDLRAQLALKTFNNYDNLNFFISRTKDYNPDGRHQTELESDKVSQELKEFLDLNGVQYVDISGDTNGYITAIRDHISLFIS